MQLSSFQIKVQRQVMEKGGPVKGELSEGESLDMSHASRDALVTMATIQLAQRS